MKPREIVLPSPLDDTSKAESGSLVDVRRQMEQRLAELRGSVIEDVDAIEDLLCMLPEEPPNSGALPCHPPRQPRLPVVEPHPPHPPAQPVAVATSPTCMECSACSSPAGRAESSVTGSRSEPSIRQSPKGAVAMAANKSINGNGNSLHFKSQPSLVPTSPKGADGTPVSSGGGSVPEATSRLATTKSSVSSFSLTERVQAAVDAGVDVDSAVRGRNALVGHHTMGNTFELAFGGVILLNALMSGVEVQWRATHIGSLDPVAFRVFRHLFTLVFMVEIGLRVRKLGLARYFCLDEDRAWAWLDVVVVVGGLFELAIDLVLWDNAEIEGSSIFRNVRLVRIVRLTRAFRLQRIIRFVSALRTLVYSIAFTLKSLFWAIVLTTIIIYVFSLAFTMEALDALESGELAGETQEALGKAWGTLFLSMSTLFQSISGGVSWRDVIDPLGESSLISVYLFTVYIAFTYFAVLNVVTGVFCSSALETTQRNPELVARTILDKRRESSKLLQNLFSAIDDDDSGLITLDELQSIASDDMVRAYFAAMEIDFRDAWTLFKLIDTEREGAVKLQDFLMACEQLKGGATNVHIAELSYDIRKLAKQLSKIAHAVGRPPTAHGG